MSSNTKQRISLFSLLLRLISKYHECTNKYKHKFERFSFNLVRTIITLFFPTRFTIIHPQTDQISVKSTIIDPTTSIYPGIVKRVLYGGTKNFRFVPGSLECELDWAKIVATRSLAAVRGGGVFN